MLSRKKKLQAAIGGIVGIGLLSAFLAPGLLPLHLTGWPFNIRETPEMAARRLQKQQQMLVNERNAKEEELDRLIAMQNALQLSLRFPLAVTDASRVQEKRELGALLRDQQRHIDQAEVALAALQRRHSASMHTLELARRRVATLERQAAAIDSQLQQVKQDDGSETPTKEQQDDQQTVIQDRMNNRDGEMDALKTDITNLEQQIAAPQTDADRADLRQQLQKKQNELGDQQYKQEADQSLLTELSGQQSPSPPNKVENSADQEKRSQQIAAELEQARDALAEAEARPPDDDEAQQENLRSQREELRHLTDERGQMQKQLRNLQLKVVISESPALIRQRLQDVQNQERAIQAELARIAHDMASVRHELAAARKSLRTAAGKSQRNTSRKAKRSH
jgi:chromosome segregation ATPase